MFTDRVGRMKIEAVRLRYEDGYEPVQPARYQVRAPENLKLAGN